MHVSGAEQVWHTPACMQHVSPACMPAKVGRMRGSSLGSWFYAPSDQSGAKTVLKMTKGCTKGTRGPFALHAYIN